MTDFTSAVSQWGEAAKARAAAVLRGTIAAAVVRVQELTPGETGALRENWSVVRDGDPVPGPGAPTLDAATTAAPGDVVRIVNPLPYANAVEYGFAGVDADGHHRHQPGHGMVAQTIVELPAIAAGVIDKVTGP